MSTLDADATRDFDHTCVPASSKQLTVAEGVASHTASRTKEYPRSRIPWAPVLSWASFGVDRGIRIPSVLDAAESCAVTSGRVAIAMALRQMKIGPGDSVLVPSYHCASMIEPVIWAGATPVFYKINLDTSVNLDDIARKIDSTTKLLLAANYFGFPQPLDKIRALCDANGLLFLEDCAHCFFGEYKGKPVGSYGDYAIASSMKFFPVYDGGYLVSSRHSLASIMIKPGSIAFEAKVAFNNLELAFEYGRLGLLKALLWLPIRMKNIFWARIKGRNPARSQSLAPGSSDGGFNFDPAWIDKRSSFSSRLILSSTSRDRIGNVRRKNYNKLLTALSGMQGGRPLFSTLPPGVYPWVFPLLMDDLEPLFDTLKSAGVPIVRFAEFLMPGVDSETCETSVYLSQKVIQFPCHQELHDTELDWIIDQIKRALPNQRAPS